MTYHQDVLGVIGLPQLSLADPSSSWLSTSESKTLSQIVWLIFAASVTVDWGGALVMAWHFSLNLEETSPGPVYPNLIRPEKTLSFM